MAGLVKRLACAAFGFALVMPAPAGADWIDGFDDVRPPQSSEAELMALCRASPGNSEESCVCGVGYAKRHLERDELAILAFMASEMQELDSDADLFLSIIERFRLDPTQFYQAMTAINRVSAEASRICEEPLLPPAAD